MFIEFIISLKEINQNKHENNDFYFKFKNPVTFLEKFPHLIAFASFSLKKLHKNQKRFNLIFIPFQYLDKKIAF